MPSDPSSARSTLAGVALIVGLVAGFAALPRVFARNEGGGFVGREAPGFSLPLVANGASLGGDGKALTMADLKGHAVLLDFWATWCGPCRTEAPIVDQVAKRWSDRGVVVVGVNADTPDQGDPVEFAKEYGLGYPIVHDTMGAAQRAYAVASLPTLVVVSRTGKIVAVRTGITDTSELEKLLRAAM